MKTVNEKARKFGFKGNENMEELKSKHEKDTLRDGHIETYYMYHSQDEDLKELASIKILDELEKQGGWYKKINTGYQNVPFKDIKMDVFIKMVQVEDILSKTSFQNWVMDALIEVTSNKRREVVCIAGDEFFGELVGGLATQERYNINLDKKNEIKELISQFGIKEFIALLETPTLKELGATRNAFQLGRVTQAELKKQLEYRLVREYMVEEYHYEGYIPTVTKKDLYAAIIELEEGL